MPYLIFSFPHKLSPDLGYLSSTPFPSPTLSPLKDSGKDVTSRGSFLWPLSQASAPFFSYWSKNWPMYQRTSREKRTIYLMISTETLNPLHRDIKKDREVFIRQYSQEMHYRNVSYIIKWHISLFPPWTPVYISTSIRDGEKSDFKKIKITRRDGIVPDQKHIMKTNNCMMKDNIQANSKIKLENWKCKSYGDCHVRWQYRTHGKRGRATRPASLTLSVNHHRAAVGCEE